MPRFLVSDTAKHVGEKVRVCGWVNVRRAHGKILFIDLRDKWGKTQIVFDPQHKADSHKTAEAVRAEYVLSVGGTVRARPQGMENKKMVLIKPLLTRAVIY